MFRIVSDFLLAKTPKSDIMISEVKQDGERCVRIVGNIDRNIYSVVSPHIQTNEVIITDERIAHIQKRHPNAFEQYAKYIQKIIEEPDYILEANKPNTAFVLKEFAENDRRFQLILRLVVEGDKSGYKNSVITFLSVEEKRYRRYLRTKNINFSEASLFYF